MSASSSTTARPPRRCPSTSDSSCKARQRWRAPRWIASTLEGVRSDIAMTRTPDGHGGLESRASTTRRRVTAVTRAPRPTRPASVISRSLSRHRRRPRPPAGSRRRTRWRTGAVREHLPALPRPWPHGEHHRAGGTHQGPVDERPSAGTAPPSSQAVHQRLHNRHRRRPGPSSAVSRGSPLLTTTKAKQSQEREAQCRHSGHPHIGIMPVRSSRRTSGGEHLFRLSRRSTALGPWNRLRLSLLAQAPAPPASPAAGGAGAPSSPGQRATNRPRPPAPNCPDAGQRLKAAFASLRDRASSSLDPSTGVLGVLAIGGRGRSGRSTGVRKQSAPQSRTTRKPRTKPEREELG
jgi:hypothetical protein